MALHLYLIPNGLPTIFLSILKRSYSDRPANNTGINPNMHDVYFRKVGPDVTNLCVDQSPQTSVFALVTSRTGVP